MNEKDGTEIKKEAHHGKISKISSEKKEKNKLIKNSIISSKRCNLGCIKNDKLKMHVNIIDK